MNLSYVKGDRVFLKDSCSQTFLGVVKSINAELGRVLLSDVVLLPGRERISGFINFDRDEIAEIKKCEVDTPVVNSVERCKCEINLKNLYTRVEISCGLSESEKPALKLSESKLKEIKKLQEEYRVIRDFGVNFHAAVSLLKSCDRIGIYGMDSTKGRFGRISVLAISSPEKVFVFDSHYLGDEIFQRGLKGILESTTTVKIVHDCRLLSDCLKHKHLVKLENVRDVEAEDVMVVFQERRTVRKHSRPLEYLLKLYLGVEVEGFQGDGDDWDKRPLAPNLLEVLVSFASFLLPLQEAIERKYLQQFVDASNLYNNHMRDLDFFDIIYDDPKKSLSKEIGRMLTPRNEVRGNCKPKKTSQEEGGREERPVVPPC